MIGLRRSIVDAIALLLALIAGTPPLSPDAIRFVRNGAVVAEIRVRAKRIEHPAKIRDAERVNFAALGEGSVVGVIRLHEPWRDYRNRLVPAGEYRLRYRVQPRLKDHAGTTRYRDFLLLEPSPPKEHPYVMAIVPPSAAASDQTIVEGRIDGAAIGFVMEGMGNIGP